MIKIKPVVLIMTLIIFSIIVLNNVLPQNKLNSKTNLYVKSKNSTNIIVPCENQVRVTNFPNSNIIPIPNAESSKKIFLNHL